MANSSVLVLPKMTTPAASNRSMTVALYGGKKLSRMRDPHVQRMSATHNTSFTAIGIPSKAGNGRSGSFRQAFKERSAASAWARAFSGFSVRKACSRGSRRSIRSKQASVSSRLEISPARKAAFISRSERSTRLVMTSDILFQYQGNAELVILGFRGISEKLLRAQARTGLVGTEKAASRQYTGGGRDAGGIQLSQLGEVFQDGRKLLAVALCFS